MIGKPPGRIEALLERDKLRMHSWFDWGVSDGARVSESSGVQSSCAEHVEQSGCDSYNPRLRPPDDPDISLCDHLLVIVRGGPG
jgi:hypothetical protein